jgi:prepilin-type N-terminal cleavage/methylation domain-containing protein
MNYELRIRDRVQNYELGIKNYGAAKGRVHNSSFIILNSGLVRGFSVFEILIVVAIVAMLSVIAVYGSYHFARSSEAQAAADNIISALSEAHSFTLSSKNDMQYGVHLESGQAVLFSGATYSSSGPNNKIFSMPRGAYISAITLNGGVTDVVFARMTGEVGGYGRVVVSSKSHDVPDKTITILSSGIFSAQ